MWSLDLPTSPGSSCALAREHECNVPQGQGADAQEVRPPGHRPTNRSHVLPGQGLGTVGSIPWLVTESKPNGAPRIPQSLRLAWVVLNDVPKFSEIPLSRSGA